MENVSISDMWKWLLFFVVAVKYSLALQENAKIAPESIEILSKEPTNKVAANYPLSCPVPFDDKSPWQYWYADPENCNSYFVCDKEQNAVRMLCPAGLWWDDVTKTCMYVENFQPKHQADCLQKLKGVGTTKQLREVFIGRCWEYQLFKNPYLFRSGYTDCESLFEEFAAVFVGKASCGVITEDDYNPLVDASITKLGPNKHLLWTGVYSMAQEYARYGDVAYTLETTLIGYILNDVTWCGQINGEGINFDWCPAFASCRNHVMASFWAAATEQFASQASGLVTIMLNGSRTDGPAFRNNSFLSEHDIPMLDAREVTLVRAWVVHDLEGPYVESCSSASLRILESRIRLKGIKFECQDNPAPVVHLLCAKKPFYPYCTLVREQGGLSLPALTPKEGADDAEADVLLEDGESYRYPEEEERVVMDVDNQVDEVDQLAAYPDWIPSDTHPDIHHSQSYEASEEEDSIHRAYPQRPPPLESAFYSTEDEEIPSHPPHQPSYYPQRRTYAEDTDATSYQPRRRYAASKTVLNEIVHKQ